MIYTLLLTVQLLVHDFHVSVTDIKFKEDKKVLQISSRIFLDDLELALRGYTADESLDITSIVRWKFIDESLANYILENLELENEKGKAYPLKYVGAEVEDDVMWCYVEVEKVKKISKLKITNTILHEVWFDQENLVHVRAYETVQSVRLFKQKNTELIELD